MDNNSSNRSAVIINNPSKRRKCPVCSKNLYLYYINFDEMFLMCEDSLCEFPFGYEAIQIVRDESQLQDDPAKASPSFFEYPIPDREGVLTSPSPLCGTICTSICTMSSVSCSCLSECEKLSLIGENEEMSIKEEPLSISLSRQYILRKKQQETDVEIEKNLKNIKKLTNEMRELEEEDINNSKVIKNKKWLETLKDWEEQTGATFLRDAEKQEMVKNEPKISMGELNISVNPDGNCSSAAVNIEIKY